MWEEEKPRVPIFARLYSHKVDVTFLLFTYIALKVFQYIV